MRFLYESWLQGDQETPNFILNSFWSGKPLPSAKLSTDLGRAWPSWHPTHHSWIARHEIRDAMKIHESSPLQFSTEKHREVWNWFKKNVLPCCRVNAFWISRIHIGDSHKLICELPLMASPSIPCNSTATELATKKWEQKDKIEITWKKYDFLTQNLPLKVWLFSLWMLLSSHCLTYTYN